MLDKDTFRTYNSYIEIEEILTRIRGREQSIVEDRLTILTKLVADWVIIDYLAAASGLTTRAIKSKIQDASLVGLLWEKQWYLLRESLEENGYDI